MYQAYAIRPVGTQVLFNPGGDFDAIFSLSAVAAAGFCSARYKDGSAGAFVGNYLLNNLGKRGLVGCNYGPALPSFPFLEDAGAMALTIRNFASEFVLSYYASDATVAADVEVQNWVKEANGAAQVIDFPAKITTTATLIDVITHMAYLAGIEHNALNINEGFSNSGVLPFHPAALYKEIPTAKGISSVLPWLPNLTQSVEQIAILTDFNRPQVATNGGNVVSMFDNFNNVKNSRIQTAIAAFRSGMTSISNRLNAQKFDANGLSRGMPFVWKDLDPKVNPYYLAV